jgi:hypothetical protein
MLEVVHELRKVVFFWIRSSGFVPWVVIVEVSDTMWRLFFLSMRSRVTIYRNLYERFSIHEMKRSCHYRSEKTAV